MFSKFWQLGIFSSQYLSKISDIMIHLLLQFLNARMKNFQSFKIILWMSEIQNNILKFSTAHNISEVLIFQSCNVGTFLPCVPQNDVLSWYFHVQHVIQTATKKVESEQILKLYSFKDLQFLAAIEYSFALPAWPRGGDCIQAILFIWLHFHS